MSTTINTKILLRYDELNNWSTSNPVLGTGEVGIAHYTSQGTNGDAQPHFFIKVGDGVTTWSALPFASGRAMDVYTWAKAPTPALAHVAEYDYRLAETSEGSHVYQLEKRKAGTNEEWTYAGSTQIDIAALVQDTNTQYQLAFSSAVSSDDRTVAIIQDKHKDLADGANWTTDQTFSVEGTEGGINIIRAEGTDGPTTTVTVPIYYDLQHGLTMEEAVSNASGAAETAQATANAAARAAATAQSTADAAASAAASAQSEITDLKGNHVAGSTTVVGGEVNFTIYQAGSSANVTVYDTATAATKAYVTAAIDSALSGITRFDYQVVNELPESGVKGTIYLVPPTSGTDYAEYIWIIDTSSPDGRWEKLGTIGNLHITADMVSFTTAFPTGSTLAGSTTVEDALNTLNVAVQTAGDVAAIAESKVDSITAGATGSGKGVSSIAFDTTTNKITLTKTTLGTADISDLATTLGNYATTAQVNSIETTLQSINVSHEVTDEITITAKGVTATALNAASGVTLVGATYTGNEGKVTYKKNGAVSTVGSFLKYDTEYILNGGTAG